MKPTMEEVAEFANVSRATVSRVLSDNPNVSADKRELVIQAVKNLGYQPLKRPKQNYSLLVNIASRHLSDPTYMSILEGMQKTALIQGYRLSINSLAEEKNPQSLLKNVEGLLILGNTTLSTEALITIKRKSMPVIVIHGAFEYEEFNYITSDERKPVVQLIQELVKLGHENIAFLAGPENDIICSERLRAYKFGIFCARLSVRQELIVHANNCQLEGGYQVAKKLLAKQKPTAIIAANDRMALGAYRAIKERNLKIPQQVSVSGFDDSEAAKHADPSLSVIQVQYRSIGEWAIVMMGNSLYFPSLPPVKIQAPCSLIMRDSVGDAI